MNTITQFTAMLKKVCQEEISSYFDVDVTMTAVTKVNDQKLLGLSFKRKDTDAAPTIYTEQFFERYKNGEDFDDLVSEILRSYLSTVMLNERFTEVPDLSYETIKDHLTLKLLEVKRNQDYLANIPFKEVGDGMALVCDIQLSNSKDQGIYRTTVNNEMMERFSYDVDEVFRQAMISAPKVEPAVMFGMSEKTLLQSEICNLLEGDDVITDEDKEQIYVLTNQTGLFGAATLFYPGMKEKIMKKLGEGYFALPSSLNEFLIVPASTNADIGELQSMVKTANQTIVQESEILSDTVIAVTTNY